MRLEEDKNKEDVVLPVKETVQSQSKPVVEGYTRKIYSVLLFISFIVFFSILKITKSVSVPVVIAVFLSLVALPFIRRMHQKLRFPWLLGIVVTLVFFIALIAVIARLLQTSVSAIVDAYPRYESRFLTIYRQIAEQLNLSYDEGKTLIENLLSQLKVRQYIKATALTVSGTALEFLKNIFIVSLMYTFLLIEADAFQTKISLAFEGKMRHRVKSIIVNVIVDTTRFFSIKFIISLLTGLFVFFGLSIIGLDFAIIWAFIAFVLNFIPTFGSAISVIGTVFFSVIQFYPSFSHVIATALLMLGVNGILGNIVEPRVEGDNLDISPFFILVSLSIWGWIWGFVGMVLAVPFTVFLKILCENIPPLKPVAIMMGNKKGARRRWTE